MRRARIDVASAARHLLAALEVNDPESVEESKRSLSRYLDDLDLATGAL